MLGYETGLEYGESGGPGEYGAYGEYGESEEFGEYNEYGEAQDLGQSEEYGESEEFGESEEYGEYGEQGLSEEEVGQLASELLEVASEEELEQFLGRVVNRMTRGAGAFFRSPIGRALGTALRQVAKRALPVVGGAFGSMVAPGIGTALGSKLGAAASGMFEVELDRLPGEQAEFEVARRYVGLSAAAFRNAAAAGSRPGVPPAVAARRALLTASRWYAPGLYRQLAAQGPRPGGRRPGPRPYGSGAAGRDGQWSPYGAGYRTLPGSGRWVRRGRRIIVLGV
jgi:uncharacterized protein (DUF697 family)